MKDTNPKDAIAGNKVPLSLCSPVAHARWAEAMVAGRCKYGAFNYRVCGARYSVYAEGAMRHILRALSGQDLDPEDQVSNLGMAMANLSIILDAQVAGTLVDDRPPSIDLGSVFSDVESNVKRLREKYADKDPHHYTIADAPKPAARPKVGDNVRIRSSVPHYANAEGVIEEDDGGSDLPFCVEIPNNTSMQYGDSRSWFDELELEVIG